MQMAILIYCFASNAPAILYRGLLLYRIRFHFLVFFYFSWHYDMYVQNFWRFWKSFVNLTFWIAWRRWWKINNVSKFLIAPQLRTTCSVKVTLSLHFTKLRPRKSNRVVLLKDYRNERQMKTNMIWIMIRDGIFFKKITYVATSYHAEWRCYEWKISNDSSWTL